MNGVSTDQIQALLIETGLLTSSAAVTETDSLFDSGILDSLRLIELVATLESRFDIRVADNELVPDNFDSIGNLASYVSAKMQ